MSVGEEFDRCGHRRGSVLSAVLGYRLRQHHVGVICWTQDAHAGGELLRKTLQEFLRQGGSFKATAEQPPAQDTVQFRVGTARKLLGTPLEGNRLQIELANHLQMARTRSPAHVSRAKRMIVHTCQPRCQRLTVISGHVCQSLG